MVEISRRAVVVAGGGGVVSAVAGAVVAKAGLGGGSLPGRAVATSFGSVAVLASSRVATSASAGGGTRHGGHGGHGAPAAGDAVREAADAVVASAVHGAWTDAVVVDVEVRNRLRRPVELSPGQFRVRVDRSGPTVSLYSADRDAALLGARSTRTVRITYLAPPPDRRLSLEFDDANARTLVGLGAVAAADRTAVQS